MMGKPTWVSEAAELAGAHAFWHALFLLFFLRLDSGGGVESRMFYDFPIVFLYLGFSGVF